jgi:hypothetical protein
MFSAKRGMLLSIGCALAAQSAHAQFFDQGFVQTPVVTTEYVSSTEGTSSNPLTYATCWFGGCGTHREVFSNSNVWRQNWPCIGDQPCVSHWITLFNQETNWDAGNSGPPNASLPRSVPGSYVSPFGFTTLFGNNNFPGDTFWRAHLVLNLGGPNPYQGTVTDESPIPIPFMAFGAFYGRGNGNTLGTLRSTSSSVPSILTFDSRLWGYQGTNQLYAYVWAEAKWGASNTPKAIYIGTFLANGASAEREDNTNAPCMPSSPSCHPGFIRWSWPWSESVQYPGDQIAYFDASRINANCPASTYPGLTAPALNSLNQGTDVHYSINLNSLFACASAYGLFDEPFPTTAGANIPVTSVFWAVEGAGRDGYVWVDVHNMKMMAANGTTPQTVMTSKSESAANVESESAANVDDASPDGIDTAVIAESLAAPACTAGPQCLPPETERHDPLHR